ncbi:MAG TPA: sugar-binding protein [Lacunisphaera sp.]|nr:sugar-binding protein [Lacunisphaera sp.]
MKPTLNKTTSPGRFVVAGLCAMAVAMARLNADAQYDYGQPGDKNYMTNTVGITTPGLGNNITQKIIAPRAQVNATFTTESIAVDGVREAAWDATTAYPIANKFLANMSGVSPSATAEGTVRMLWDGPVLYVLVEVTGDSTKADTGTPAWTAGPFNSTTATTDGLFVFMDVFNDKWGFENDTAGVFLLGANPALTSVTSFNNSGIPSLGSFFNPNNQDYSTRLKAFKSSGYNAAGPVNYTYEFALQIEGWGDAWDRELTNGTKIGFDTAIFNQGASFTYLSKTLYFGTNEGGSNLPNSERPRNKDWGEVTLTGWDGTTPFAYSGWRADEDIRFWNSKSNPGGASGNGDLSVVWTPESKALFVGAKNDYLALKASGTATREQLEAAVEQVCQTFTLLTWGDTRFPDPRDLPATQTLPNVWKFFDPSKGTGGMVTNLAEWAQRKEEIKELAQFYEYGYKPKLGVDYTINVTTNAYNGTGTSATVIAQVIPTNVNWIAGATTNVTVTVTFPTAGLPVGQKAVIGFSTSMTANGIANVGLPTNWGADIRSDAGAWGTPNASPNGNTNRTGTFYTIFPYRRNSTFGDVSYCMATATGTSIFLDILQAACAANPALDAKIDPTRAITKGFSINGKLAFIAAVYDDRVKAVIAGGAGATGPANWRYNCQGQEFSFTGTPFYNAGAEAIVSHGTEGPGNSYRHNRVRETELFRHFMDYGHMYSHEEGAYGYGRYSRMPFDNALLVACLAPDRAIMIDTNMNDYNDGAVTDNMSLQVAKFVYKGLRADPEKYIKFNSGNYVSTGDPHGAAPAAPEGRFFSDFFYGTATQTAADVTKLAMDPYSLLVCNGQTQTPYDFYWGGFNTITGGTGGISGTDGWFSYYLNPLGVTRGGFLLNRRTNQVSQQVTIRNTSTASVKGPIYLVLDSLSGNTTLVNASGTTSGGKPYYVASAGDLAPGAALTFVLTFTNPASGGISYNPLTPPSL